MVPTAGIMGIRPGDEGVGEDDGMGMGMDGAVDDGDERERERGGNGNGNGERRGMEMRGVSGSTTATGNDWS